MISLTGVQYEAMRADLPSGITILVDGLFTDTPLPAGQIELPNLTLFLSVFSGILTER